MKHQDTTETAQAVPGRLDALVEMWFQGIAPYASQPIDGDSVRVQLATCLEQAVAYLTGEVQRVGLPESIGAMLVSAGFDHPQALGRSLEFLGTAVPGRDMQSRSASFLGGIAAGHSRAVQERVLAQQETLRAELQTVRGESERTLAANQAHFRQLIDLLPVGYLLVDRGTGKIRMANRPAASWLGVGDPGDLSGRTGFDFIQSDQIDMAHAHVARMATGDATTDFFEEGILQPDGSTRHVEFSGRYLAEIDDPVVQVIFRDITDRKRAEAALRESEALFRTLAETTASAIFMFVGARNTYVNKAACEITGYTRDELLAMPFWQLVRSDYQALVRERGLAQLSGEPIVRYYEVPIVAKDGTTRWLQFAGQHIDYQGVQAVLGTAIDITASKLAEEALRESELKFRTLAELTPAAILIIRNNIAYYVNPGLEALIGHSFEEFLSLPIESVVAPESLPLLTLNLAALQSGDPRAVIEIKIRSKSGEVKWVSASWRQIELLGEQASLVTGFDITQRVETERKLRSYAKRLELLGEIDRVGLTANPKHVIASEVLHLITTLVHCDRASISELDNIHRSMLILAVCPRERTQIVEGRRFRLDQWHALAAYLQYGPVYIADLAEVNPRSALQEEIYREGVRSYLSIPLTHQGSLVGVLSLGSFDAHAYGEDDKLIAYEVAQRVAMVLRNAQLFAEVEASRDHLKKLARELVLVQENERRFLARELHDEVAQALTALNISLELASHATGVRRDERLAEAQRWVEDLAQRVRQLSLDLRPPMLDDLGLLPTLFWYFERCAQQLRIDVDFEHQGAEQRFDPEVEIVVYRIVQETITNIARHAGTRTATVRLWVSPTTLSVQVEDRGKGFNAQEIFSRSMSGGLSGMRERVRQLGGQLVIDAHPGTGTCVTALVPLVHN